MEKDYSLLRPFDLEAAKRGEAVIWHPDQPVRWIALSDKNRLAHNIVEHATGLSYVCDSELAMEPLCWVEGRPVYLADVLWHKIGKFFVTIEQAVDDQYFSFDGEPYDYRFLTWAAPAVKRKVKLLAYLGEARLFWQREDYPKSSGSLLRVPSEDKIIEVEESAEASK